MQLRSKLLLAFLAVSLLPLAVLGFQVYRSTVRHTERLVGHRLQANGLQVADAIAITYQCHSRCAGGRRTPPG
jgi:hypothetical protein